MEVQIIVHGPRLKREPPCSVDVCPVTNGTLIYYQRCRIDKDPVDLKQCSQSPLLNSISVERGNTGISCLPPGADRQETIPSREQSSGRGSRTKGSHGPSLSYNIAKWTKKVSGFACGATLDATRSPAEERTSSFPPSGGPSSMAIEKKPSRTQTTFDSTSSYKSNASNSKHKKSSPEDYDHHTLATAATASATISYSTDQGDDASEMGMEVIISESAHDQIGVEPYVSHSFPAGKHTFVVDKRYTMIRTIGSGAYGVVISASDTKSQSNVAVKMVPKAFSDEIDAKRILREIKLLKHFEHENIISLLDMMPPNVKYAEDFKDVYLVTDLMETDLHRIIYSKQKLSIDHAQYFIYQVLRGLKYIHSCRVLHRDLKPSNLLVNSNCDLKICDFGLARGLHKDPGDPSSLGSSDSGTLLLTEYVVTRWYRAPEIMLACHEYSYQIDVWSVGCILAELILRKPYFPGDDYIDQLTIITQKLGKLPEADLNFVTSEKAKRFMKKLPNKAPTPLTQQFPGTPTKALDCMRKMLEIHPDKRLSVEQAIKHPFFESLHNPKDEPVSSRPFDFSFEDQKLNRVRLQELIWAEVGDFRPSAMPVAPRRDSKTKE